MWYVEEGSTAQKVYSLAIGLRTTCNQKFNKIHPLFKYWDTVLKLVSDKGGGGLSFNGQT